MTDVAHVNAALVAFLKADTAVAALVSTRVFADEEGFRGIVGSVRIACVTLARSGRVAGESDNGYGPLSRPRFDVKCYGVTRYEASKVYAAVHAAMKGMTPQTVSLADGDTRLYNATVSGGPLDLTDPDVDDAPVVWGAYGVLYDERAVVSA